MKNLKKLFRKPHCLRPFLGHPLTFYYFLFSSILTLTIPPSGHGSPSISIEKRVTIAVANLTSNALSHGEIVHLTASLRDSLVKTGHFQVVKEDYMKAVFTQQKFQKSEQCERTECLVEMGKLLEVEKVVGGTIGKSGSMVNISLRLVNVGTGKLEWEFQEKIKGGLDDLLVVMRSFANKLASLKENEMKMEQERIAREKEKKIRLEEERQQLKQEELKKGPPWLIIGGVLAAGGLAVAAAGSSGSDGDGGKEAVSVAGVWSLNVRCDDGSSGSGTIDFKSGGTFRTVLGNWTGTGVWTYNNPTLKYTYSTGETFQGSVTASTGTFSLRSQICTDTISR